MMKSIFILDENVFIQSHTCRNTENTQDDYNSFHLILHIREECHKIGLTNDLITKYYEKSKTLEKKKAIDGKSIKIWKELISRSDKQLWCSNTLKDLPTNLEHDRHVIEPTMFLRGVLVTTDKKLKSRLPKWAEKKGYSITVKSPADVLKKSDS